MTSTYKSRLHQQAAGYANLLSLSKFHVADKTPLLDCHLLEGTRIMSHSHLASISTLYEGVNAGKTYSGKLCHKGTGL